MASKLILVDQKRAFLPFLSKYQKWQRTFPAFRMGFLAYFGAATLEGNPFLIWITATIKYYTGLTLEVFVRSAFFFH